MRGCDNSSRTLWRSLLASATASSGNSSPYSSRACFAAAWAASKFPERRVARTAMSHNSESCRGIEPREAVGGPGKKAGHHLVVLAQAPVGLGLPVDCGRPPRAGRRSCRGLQSSQLQHAVPIFARRQMAHQSSECLAWVAALMESLGRTFRPDEQVVFEPLKLRLERIVGRGCGSLGGGECREVVAQCLLAERVVVIDPRVVGMLLPELVEQLRERRPVAVLLAEPRKLAKRLAVLRVIGLVGIGQAALPVQGFPPLCPDPLPDVVVAGGGLRRLPGAARHGRIARRAAPEVPRRI